MGQLHTASLIFDKKLKGHLPVTRFSLSASGEVMVALPDEHQARLYHLVRIGPAGGGEELGTFAVETLSHIDFSENGRIFVAATDDDVYVFRDDQKTRFFPDRRDNYLSLSLSSSGEYFAVVSADMILSGYAVTLARTSGGQVWTKDAPFTVTAVQIAADASRILVGSEEGTAVMLDNARATIWQFDGSDPIADIGISGSLELSVLATKGGAVTAIGPLGNKLWEVIGDGPAECCAISGDGSMIATAHTSLAGDARVEFFDDNGTPLLEHEAPAKVSSVVSSSDGRFAALSCEDGTLQVLEIALAPPRARTAETVRALYDEACLAVERSDLAGAVQKLTRVLELDPCHADACRKLAETREAFVNARVAEAEKLENEGSLPQSVRELQSAMELSPYSRDVFEKLVSARERLVGKTLSDISALAGSGNLEEAIEKLEDLIRLDFANVRAREELGRLEEALAARYASDADAALDSGQAAKAVQILEKACELRPTEELQQRLSMARAKQAFDEGVAFYEAKKYSQALFQFRKVLSVDSENREALKYVEYCESLGQDDSLFDRFSKLE